MQEHCCNLKKRDVAASAVAEHAFSCNKMNLSKALVIDAHPHTQARCMLECWHIQHNPASLNIHSLPKRLSNPVIVDSCLPEYGAWISQASQAFIVSMMVIFLNEDGQDRTGVL